MGHSGGGFSTYALVTQTNRFKAAVTMAGFTDIVSFAGTFDPPSRYGSDDTQLLLYGAAWAETGQGSLGPSLLANPWKYWRNSPVLFADRVTTPLLLVAGDLDFVPIQQAEEMFGALHRLGKRATFVRYWGEGHDPESPANIRDLWARIFAWFATHLSSAATN